MAIAPIPSAVCCKISHLQKIKPIIVTYLSTQCVVRKFSPYSNLLSSYGNKEKKPKEVEEQQLEQNQRFILWVCLGCPKKDFLQLPIAKKSSVLLPIAKKSSVCTLEQTQGLNHCIINKNFELKYF